jgi:hypothetical protein
MYSFIPILHVCTVHQRPNYDAFTDKFESNCHFPAPGWNCMTHGQALQVPDTSQVSLHKSNEINLPILAVPAGSREVIVAFIFISERTLCHDS